MKNKISFLGVSMHPLTMSETIEEIDRRLERAEFTQHVVVNVAKLVHMQRDLRLREAIESCDIINIDGSGVVFGARLMGNHVPERVAGIDLFIRLLTYAERHQRSVFFLGADEHVIEMAVRNIRNAHPTLPIAGYHHGYFWGKEDAVVKAIRESGAHLLFVGISSPKKEQFIHQYRAELGVLFAMGVGGSFDIVAGKVKRAPLWMQKSGFEWLFRVVQEPRRMFVRYFKTNVVFGVLLAKAAASRWYYEAVAPKAVELKLVDRFGGMIGPQIEEPDVIVADKVLADWHGSTELVRFDAKYLQSAHRLDLLLNGDRFPPSFDEPAPQSKTPRWIRKQCL